MNPLPGHCRGCGTRVYLIFMWGRPRWYNAIGNVHRCAR